MRLFDLRTLIAFRRDSIEKIVELLTQLLMLGCRFDDAGLEFGVFG